MKRAGRSAAPGKPENTATAILNEQKTEAAAQRIVGIALKRRERLGRVLDVGCGIGQILLAAQPKAVSLAGIDIEDDYLAAAERALPSASLMKGSVEDAVPFEGNTFDTIFFCDVIEHLRRPIEALLNLRAALADGGLLVVTTPNADAVMRVLLGDKWFGLSDESHVLFYTSFTLSHALKKTGYTDLRAETIGWTRYRALNLALETLKHGGTLVVTAINSNGRLARR